MPQEPNGSAVVTVPAEDFDGLLEALDRLTKSIEDALVRETRGEPVDLQQLWTEIKQAREIWPPTLLPSRGQP
jgi:hypothetical protein